MNLQDIILSNLRTNPFLLLIYLLISSLIGILIAILYKKTHQGISYSQSFVQALVILMPIGTLVFYFVSQNIATAIGLFGAFSLIRFRAAVKEIRDMLYIFWVLSLSLVLGSGEIIITILAFIFISIVILFLYYNQFGKIAQFEYLLLYTLDINKNNHATISKKLNKFTKYQEIINIKNIKNSKLLDINLGIKLKKNIKTDDLVNFLVKTKGIKNANIISTKNNTEF